MVCDSRSHSLWLNPGSAAGSRYNTASETLLSEHLRSVSTHSAASPTHTHILNRLVHSAGGNLNLEVYIQTPLLLLLDSISPFLFIELNGPCGHQQIWSFDFFQDEAGAEEPIRLGLHCHNIHPDSEFYTKCPISPFRRLTPAPSTCTKLCFFF